MLLAQSPEGSVSKYESFVRARGPTSPAWMDAHGTPTLLREPYFPSGGHHMMTHVEEEQPPKVLCGIWSPLPKDWVFIALPLMWGTL